MLTQSRGMMSTMFVVMKAGVSVDDLHQHLVHRYHVSSFALFLYDVLCGTCSYFLTAGSYTEDH